MCGRNAIYIVLGSEGSTYRKEVNLLLIYIKDPMRFAV